jgi:hypothetical protein
MKYNIKTYFREIRWEEVSWIHSKGRGFSE